MEELKAGAFIIPRSMTSLVVVDNAVPQPNNVGHGYAINKIFFCDTAFNTQSLSGLIINRLSESLLDASHLDHIDAFSNRTNLLPFVKDYGFNYPMKLSPESRRAYSDSTSAQLLLSLDFLQVMSVTQLKTMNYSMSDATRDLTLNSIWRLYDLKADTLMHTFACADSMFWENSYVVTYNAAMRLPRVDTVLNEIATVFAAKVAQKILPKWVTVERFFYANGSSRMHQATEWLLIDSLDKAAKLWEEEYNHAIFRSKYRSAMNMILYYEAKGMPKVEFGMAG